MSLKPRLLGIVGPTASGKTGLSMMLKDALPIEIVCMDSMQIYRGLDIGTAKPSPEERSLVPHHMLDRRAASEGYSVAEYRQEAMEAIAGILSRGALPVLVGGTGLYLRALSLPLDFGGTAADQRLRAQLKEELDRLGAPALHERLRRVDPESAERLHPNDVRRVMRALEVHAITGRPFSAQRMPGPEDGPYDIRLYAPDWPREQLYRRIDQRVDVMLAQGLVEELKGLLRDGVPEDAQSLQGLGYEELIPYLKGEAGYKESAELIKRRTRNYAKRQLTWFRRDGRIRWIAPGMAQEDFVRMIVQEMEAG